MRYEKRCGVWQLVSVLALALLVQATSPAQPRRLSPEERTAELKKELSLTEEQAAKVKSIFEQHDKEVRKLFEASGGDRAAMREAMQQKVKQTDEKILALLNPEQKAKYTELMKERRARFEQRRRERE
jgi:Spy/CpxP family protein refolding chaperone